MAQPFDANKLTNDLKQMLKLSQSIAESDTKLAQNTTEIKHSNKNPESGPAPITTENSKNVTSSPSSKSSSEKTRRKKQKQEKQATKAQGKSSTTNNDSPPCSDIKVNKNQGIRNNSSSGKNSSVIVLPSKNKEMGNSDNSTTKSQTEQGSKSPASESSKSQSSQSPKSQKVQVPNRQTKENNGNNACDGSGKNKYDNLSRQIQIKLDENKIFFLKNRNSRFPNAKYFCRYCDYHMDTIEICEKHLEEAKHRHKKEVGSMDSILRKLPPPTEKHIEAITESIDLLYDECGIKPKDRDVRKGIVERLENEIKKEIPDVVLYMYGSSVTCMGLVTSDININLTSTVKDKKLTSLLQEIYKLLKDRTDSGFINVHSDFSASVPVLLMNDTETGYKLNIAIHVYNSLCTSELLSIYSDFDERTIKLAIAFRYWATLSGVDRHSAGFIPPIALNIMVIFFLQTTKPSALPIIPPPGVYGEDGKDFMKDKTIFQLKRNKVMSRKAELTNDMSVGELWVRLLRFYTIELDISEVVISIKSASPISRRNKPWNSRKLAVEEPYMGKNLARMLGHCYEYWQYITRKAYHYFGLPRGTDGNSFLPEYNLPDVGVVADAPQSERSATGQETIVNTKDVDNCEGENVNKKEHCAENDGDKSRPELLPVISESDNEVSQKGENSSPKYEYHNDQSSSGTHAAEIPSTSQFDKLSSQTSVETNVDIETKDSEGFISNYVDSIVEKALDLVNPRSSTSSLPLSPPPSLLPSPTPEPIRKYTDAVESLKSKSEDSTSKDKMGILNEKCFFEFNKNYLTDKKEPAMVCVICEKEGHHKNECPENVLPEVLPVQGFTEHHHKVLEETLKKMPSEVGLSDISLMERKMFLNCLEEFIQVGFPGARLTLFGSSCNGFGFDRSDMDICMTFVKKRPNIDKVYAVERLANILMVHNDLKNVQAISTAKVPIVKFTIRSIDLDADISLYNTLAQENTRLLSSYSKIDPRVQILGYTIKMFAQVCDIGDASRGSLSSYGYILMMLYYLQQVEPPVIPVLQEIHDMKMKPEKIVEGCDAWFMSDLSKLPELWPEMGQNKMSVAELWFGFLRFYVEEFNYRELVISIRQKEPLTRFEKLWNGFCLAIEDPFDLNHNLGSGLTRSMNNFILKTFINGRMLYGSPIDDNMELFNKYQTPSDYFFDTELLSEARPTTSRGCRSCGKIGHLMRHCPLKREKDDEQHKEQQKKRKEQQSMQSDHRLPHYKENQQRQHHSQYQRSQGQHADRSGKHPHDMHGHYSPRDDRHSSQRQQQKAHAFQHQENQKIQKRIERDLYGERSQGGSDQRQNSRSPAGPGHNFKMGNALAPTTLCGSQAALSVGQHMFLPSHASSQPQPTSANLSSDTSSYLYNRPALFAPRPKMVNPAYISNQRHNGPPHQYPPSLRPRSGAMMDNPNQFAMYGMNAPPPGMMQQPFPFYFNNPSGGSNNSSNSLNTSNNSSSQRMGMMPPPPPYMKMPPNPQGPPGAPPSLLPHPAASQTNTRGMSPVVQNLFASTQGKVMDARMMHPNARKKN